MPRATLRLHHAASVALRRALPGVAREDPNALFVASSFIAIYAFASPSVVRHGDDPRALAWFPVLRGIPAVTRGVTNVLRELAPKLAVPAGGPARHAALLPPLPADLGLVADAVADADEREVIRAAIGVLRHSWELHRAMTNDFWLAAAFMWPAKLDARFVHLMAERRPAALILLAYYNAMFSMLSGFWWIGARAKEELAVIEKIVDKDWGDRWLPWVRKVVAGDG